MARGLKYHKKDTDWIKAEKRRQAKKEREYRGKLRIQRLADLFVKFPELIVKLIKHAFGDLEFKDYFLEVERDVKVLFSDVIVRASLGLDISRQKPSSKHGERTDYMGIEFLDRNKQTLYQMSMTDLESLSPDKLAELVDEKLLRPLNTWSLNSSIKHCPLEKARPQAMEQVEDINSQKEAQKASGKEPLAPTDRKKKLTRIIIDDISNYLKRLFGKGSIRYRLFQLEVKDRRLAEKNRLLQPEVEDHRLVDEKRKDEKYASILKTKPNYISQCRAKIKKAIQKRFGIDWDSRSLIDKV